MKYTVTETKCEAYQIIGFRNASDDADIFFKEDINHAPLRFGIRYQHLDGKKIDNPVGVLPQPFDAACRGESSDWKLVRIDIREKELELGFMCTKGTEMHKGMSMFRYPGESIHLRDFVGAVTVEAKRQGTTTLDHYDIEMHDESDGATGERQWIASIREYRYGEEYAYEVFSRGRNGDTYLESFRYD